MPDAIDPNAPTPEANDPNAQGEKPDPLANLSNIVNSAVASQLKRALGGLDKMIADAVGKVSLPPPPPPDAKPGAPAPDPEFVKLREKFDKLSQEHEAERRARRETEERSRNERTDGALREALRSKGVRPELLTGAFHALKATALRFDDEGTPRLAISRSRERGRAAEEVAFSIDEGVTDWLKSDEAKAYLPPPAPPPKQPAGAAPARPLGADGKPRVLSREEAISVSLAQAAERGSRS